MHIRSPSDRRAWPAGAGAAVPADRRRLRIRLRLRMMAASGARGRAEAAAARAGRGARAAPAGPRGSGGSGGATGGGGGSRRAESAAASGGSGGALGGSGGSGGAGGAEAGGAGVPAAAAAPGGTSGGSGGPGGGTQDTRMETGADVPAGRQPRELLRRAAGGHGQLSGRHQGQRQRAGPVSPGAGRPPDRFGTSGTKPWRAYRFAIETPSGNACVTQSAPGQRLQDDPPQLHGHASRSPSGAVGT